MYTDKELLFIELMRKLSPEGKKQVKQLMQKLVEEQDSEREKLIDDRTKELNEMISPEMASEILTDIIDEAPEEIQTPYGKVTWIAAQSFIKGALFQYDVDLSKMNH